MKTCASCRPDLQAEPCDETRCPHCDRPFPSSAFVEAAPPLRPRPISRQQEFVFLAGLRMFAYAFLFMLALTPVVLVSNLVLMIVQPATRGETFSQVLSAGVGFLLLRFLLSKLRKFAGKRAALARDGSYALGCVEKVESNDDNDSIVSYSYWAVDGQGQLTARTGQELNRWGLVVGQPLHVIYFPDDSQDPMLFVDGKYEDLGWSIRPSHFLSRR